MPGKISFNLDDYKNEFVARIADSYIEVVGDNEVWRQTLVRQMHQDTGWMDIVLTEPKCFLDENCPHKAVMHNHQSLWALKFKGSPLHRFLEALKDNTKLSINDPEQFKGHTFKFYQWDQPEWFNKKTQQTVKSKPYFFVAGWPAEEEAAEVSADLPWDAPAQSSAPAQTVAAPTNGAVAVNPEEAFEIFAVYCDGKNDQQIKQGVVVNKDLPDLHSVPNFRVNVMSGALMKDLVETKNMLTKSEDGIYHLV